MLDKTAEATDKIAKRTKKTKKILKELPAEIAAAMPVQEMPEESEQELEPAPKESKPARGRINIFDKFTNVAINEIKTAKILVN